MLAGPGNRVDAGIQSRGDLAVTPSFAGLGGVGLQQDACLHQLAGAVLALRINMLSRLRSSSLSFTTYFFTTVCFAVTTHLRHYGAIGSEIDRNIKDVGY